ncbi:MAG: alcohol dehydrogenase catalytic domain-containing protein [Bacteroidales bacterium]|nr:alcohol dehydrogenase catalytic domain-containing protein [Bacteroidales bacterium]
MRAAVLTAYGSISEMEVPLPEKGPGDVLVKIRYASICGSDQHIFRGEFHPRTKLPLVPGHEFAGVVESTGKNVSRTKAGMKVTVDPIIWCGKCQACLEGHFPACTSLKLKGIDMDGGFAEYISVPEGMIFNVPDSIPDEHAALVEVLSIGFHASARAGLKSDDDIFIMGAGKVGQSIMHAASTITRGKIIIADILPERLSLASSSLPGVFTVNTLKDDPLALVKDITGGKGVDVAFEAVGHEVSVEGRLNPVRACINVIKGAGVVCVLGLSDHPSPLLMKELIWKEARIIASRVSHGEFSQAIAALAEKRLDPSLMITGILDLGEAQKGFEMLENEPSKHLKILLKVS